jgi:hypothetical protein
MEQTFSARQVAAELRLSGERIKYYLEHGEWFPSATRDRQGWRIPADALIAFETRRAEANAVWSAARKLKRKPTPRDDAA